MSSNLWLDPPPFTDDAVPPAPELVVEEEPIPKWKPPEGMTERERTARLIELREHYSMYVAPPEIEREMRGLEELDPGDVGSLRQWKTKPPPQLQSRIETLYIAGTNLVIFGRFKSGKSVLWSNLVPSYVDGTDFLGHYPTIPIDGTLCVLDWEDTPQMLFNRLDRLPLTNDDKVVARSLRDSGLRPTDDAAAEFLVRYLKRHEAETILVNTVSSSFDGDPNKFARAATYLERLDKIKDESGAKEIILVAHVSHASSGGRQGSFGVALNSEHIFGSSQFSNWLDAGLGLSVGPGGVRYLKPMTRLEGEAPPSVALRLDYESMRLSVSHELSAEHTVDVEEMSGRMLAFIEENPGRPTRAVLAAVPGAKDDLVECRKQLVRDGRVRTKPGPRKAQLHYLVEEKEEGE